LKRDKSRGEESLVQQSLNTASVSFARTPYVPDRVRETQSFRGIVIGIALSAVLWAPLGLIAFRIF
jgi:hypothetical protein